MKKILGDLFRRIELNRNRLKDSMYLAKDLFDQNDSWPGDFQGRDILALTSLYKAYEGYDDKQKDVLKQLEDIFALLDQKVNRYGYFGKEFNGEYVNEQQVSSNSWFIRGLVNYYNITKNDKYLKQIKSIVDNFLVPISSFYERYPTQRKKQDLGGVSGFNDGTVINGWELSTDIGCAFIMLDGISAAYEVYQDEKVKNIIELMINAFLKIDYLNLECQTHATLSCTRGIIRYSKYNKKYFNYAVRIFDDYLSKGMTYDYANINWFNRFTTWTEPCGIIDSMIIARKLYEITKEEKYLDVFNRIYTNSLRTFQRINGGAGCSTCAIKDNYLMKSYLYEAFFCCTMRLGDGLCYLTNFSIVNNENNLIVNFPVKLEYEDDNISFLLDNEFYYNDNRIIINVTRLIKPIVLKIRLPKDSFVEKYDINGRWLEVNLTEEKEYVFNFKNNINSQNGILFFGDMLLTKKKEKMEHELFINKEVYSYVYDNSKFDERELDEKVQYVK